MPGNFTDEFWKGAGVALGVMTVLLILGLLFGGKR